MATPLNRFLLIFRDPGDAAYLSVSPEERQHLLERWTVWIEELTSRGEIDDGHPLEPTGHVVAGHNGERISEAPHSDGQEMIGGYLLLRVPDLNAATAIAQQCPGLAYGLTVEVRPAGERCARLHAPSTTAAVARLAT